MGIKVRRHCNTVTSGRKSKNTRVGKSNGGDGLGNDGLETCPLSLISAKAQLRKTHQVDKHGDTGLQRAEKPTMESSEFVVQDIELVVTPKHHKISALYSAKAKQTYGQHSNEIGDTGKEDKITTSTAAKLLNTSCHKTLPSQNNRR